VLIAIGVSIDAMTSSLAVFLYAARAPGSGATRLKKITAMSPPSCTQRDARGRKGDHLPSHDGTRGHFGSNVTRAFVAPPTAFDALTLARSARTILRLAAKN
jgi:hypothetical protein